LICIEHKKIVNTKYIGDYNNIFQNIKITAEEKEEKRGGGERENN